MRSSHERKHEMLMQHGATVILVGLCACGGRDRQTGDPTPHGPGPADPLRVQWELLPSDEGPPPRGRPAMAALGDRVVLFAGGGVRFDTFRADTWIYEDGVWREVTTDPMPPARREASMAPLGGRLIMWGGLGQSAEREFIVHQDTWAFDGERWEKLDVGESAPAIRGGAAATAGDRIVAFGGLDGPLGERSGDTFVFDGDVWTRLSPDVAPPPVRNTAMTTIADAAYLTGGSAPAALSDVWRWDGQWEKVGALDRGRAYHSAGALREHLIVFGGVRTSTNTIGETDAWPGPIELFGDAPEAGSGFTMVNMVDHILMWGGDPAETWTLRPLDP